ncbi:MAG TPA: pyruvate:ferredoxin (flavodoxin) oxidoreductase [Polyangiaceae bacterium]|jgi:pyruvate-ferredoxin/flavodoxin oxidoreductase|nr:MAG: Pyruvate-flavodoxin oxidoreductase [Deltaproteobacteria bacterium ADurb.Bin207]HNS96911.1 pyruvate:ferredoxin (flavodoxin) oxidoreductase [Polyangiaceae bacterium]HNZ21065.1 pyruvate:ferredoxin (flavodoxin) oxidoreductase [Polyangiaceae bacterium]HOD22310.1 pyruvate:ferredoxin (flavodoxin) oxidoreductase [Polyangiaceae bacterium]HOE47835.1 pyruvate:ferredoxin (flavodoxin) oxidoreductase [Polyangiaceae bacterium]
MSDKMIPADRKPEFVTIDGNTAVAHVAHAVNEVIAIYPITPSSVMGELADEKSAAGETNIWGSVPHVVELQSEGGASGAVHGALQVGALTTTFTASQGLLLMIPNMFKIAGELTSTVFHVSARAVASHALSIFGDHSDVMACRSTGWALIASGAIQECMDMAMIAHAATLEARVPFIHFFDGFRSSHEVQKIESLSKDDMRYMIQEDLVHAHRARGLSPDRPVLRGTAQNPDVFFQHRETMNSFYTNCPGIVQKHMDRFAKLTGRHYHLFDYVGAPDAEDVVVVMGSGAEAVHEVVEHLVAKGRKVGMVKVRLFRPWSIKDFLAALPKTTKRIAVLDRTKEPGAIGDPMYQDVQSSFVEALANDSCPLPTMPRIYAGRYGLGSKEFNAGMVLAVFDNLVAPKPKNHFVCGIVDDVTHTSLDWDNDFDSEAPGTVRALFYGLGSDGTVGANKNSIKIIGEETDNYAQGYFVYDSKKAGSMTVSHLRFGAKPIRSTYLLTKADFVACHQFVFTEKFDMLKYAVEGGTFLLNSPYSADEVWDKLPKLVQQRIIDKKLKFYAIDAYSVAKATGMGARINSIMQTCFFAISGILPREEAIAKIKTAIKKTYGVKGDVIVEKNWKSVDQTLEHLHQVKVPDKVTSQIEMPPVVSPEAPAFVRNVLGPMIGALGDSLPVSAFPIDGTYPTATSQWEKRNIALEVPIWIPELCIQCGKCAIVCPHAAIRTKVFPPESLVDAPETFQVMDFKDRDLAGMKYSIQVFVEDCTGCRMCVEACPGKDKKNPSRRSLEMADQIPLREPERKNAAYFMRLPDADRTKVKQITVKGSQLLRPLFEFSGACAGCGETPYVKLLTQLFGDRAIIANATGCSSIYSGNLPTTPYAVNEEGRGPAWSNSLFEDNAEFGFGFRLAVDKFKVQAEESLVRSDIAKSHPQLVEQIKNAVQIEEPEILEQRARVAELKKILATKSDPESKALLTLADYLVKKSIWIVGGDGWAYDIGYGGLDHVLASGRNVNVLVLDTEVYSNTGGQMSKATPVGAVAKFAAAGKPIQKKDLALISASYGYIYVATVAMGANDAQTVRAFVEAEAYDGPSIIIAYSHCIAHGIDMAMGMTNQKRAVESGHFPLFRYNPDLAAKGENPLKLDSKAPKIPFEEYAYAETRWKMLTKSKPERAKELLRLAGENAQKKWLYLDQLAKMSYEVPGK